MPLQQNASLKEVMDNFEKITLLDLANIDIITASELPLNVKNGQVVIIGSNINNIYITNKTEIELKENDVVINLCEGGESFCICSDNKYLKIDIYGAKQYINSDFVGLDSFIGIENAWIPMNEFYFFKEGAGLDYADLFTLYKSDSVNAVASLDNEKIRLKHSVNATATHSAYATYKNMVDFSHYKTLYLDASLSINSSCDCYLYILDSEDKTIRTTEFSKSFSRKLEPIDISDLSGYYKIKLYIKAYGSGASTASVNFNIFNLYLNRL